MVLRNMLNKQKRHINRIWKGPGPVTHVDSQSGWTLFIPNDGGLERKFKAWTKNIWRKIKKFSTWIIAVVLLSAISFFVPYLLGKWLS